jgi:hypothetical protein
MNDNDAFNDEDLQPDPELTSNITTYQSTAASKLKCMVSIVMIIFMLVAGVKKVLFGRQVIANLKDKVALPAATSAPTPATTGDAGSHPTSTADPSTGETKNEQPVVKSPPPPGNEWKLALAKYIRYVCCMFYL